MYRPLRCFCWSVLAIILIAPHGAHAQISLLFPTGIRSYGLGETGVADAADPTNAFFNPAILFTLRRAHVTWGHTDFPSSASMNALAVSGGYELGSSTSTSFSFGADLRYTKLDTKDFGIDVFDRYWGVSLAAGLNVDDRFQVGLGGSIKPVKAQFVGIPFAGSPIVADATTTTYDVGFFVSSRTRQGRTTSVFSLGASALNIGDDTPEEARIGIGLKTIGEPHPGLSRALGTPVPAFSIAFNAEIEFPKGSAIEIFRGGLEVGVMSLVFLRAGVMDLLTPSGFGNSPAEITLGVGLNLPYERFEARLDYARFKPGFFATHRVGVTVAFLY